ncbi:MAG: threonine synthase [candidate division KSB1 bacterium]|nr:threonine synthase [candidate division KSB1 bacterium]MDZ7303338.1 threonine synthase [candidate division KSB1 bacterium]MDZ7310412.1 threonine synthase [candidate division KSB1 bacterium]
MFSAHYHCLNHCLGEYRLDTIIYNCPHCGDLLEVRHDLDALRQKSAAEWKMLFDQRYRGMQWPYNFGVWGKKEWVNPHVADENIVSLGEGGTHLFRAERFGKWIGLDNLWVKQCGNSHTGSFKDLGMTVLVSQVRQILANGKKIRAVVCASTGDTSASLAAYCAAAGIPAVVLLPKEKISPAQLIQPIANGALTLALDTDFDGCMAIVKELARRPDIYLANSMNSLRLEGQKTISIEITQQLGWEAPDWVIVPGGNLGNISAIGRGFLMMRDLGLIDCLPRLVCAQAEKANPLYESYKTGFREFHPRKAAPTVASAIQIGNPVSVKRAIAMLKEFDGIVEQASEDELVNAAALGDKAGLFNCPHTGVALAALIKLIERGEIKRNHRVVVISTANGLKFPEFKVRYHLGQLAEVKPRHRNGLVEVPADLEMVMEAIAR